MNSLFGKTIESNHLTCISFVRLLFLDLFLIYYFANQPTNQSTNQPTNQTTINQPTNQPSINQSINQSIIPPAQVSSGRMPQRSWPCMNLPIGTRPVLRIYQCRGGGGGYRKYLDNAVQETDSLEIFLRKLVRRASPWKNLF